jgi:hypothetical protein
MAKDFLKFQQIDVDSLDTEQGQAFHDYLRAKSAFRAALQSMAPSGCKIVFTEKYGTVENPGAATLKVALVKASTKAAATKKSLADYIDEQDGAGLAR